MASEFTILGLLEDEIETFLIKMVPTAKPTLKFHRHRDRNNPLSKMTGPPRLFDVGPAISSPDNDGQPVSIGIPGTRAPAYLMPIQLLYPTDDPTWRTAALNDAQQIFARLENRATEPSGVQIREMQGTPDFDAYPLDSWEIMTLTIRAVLSAT